jgi:hypothetical protein
MHRIMSPNLTRLSWHHSQVALLKYDVRGSKWPTVADCAALIGRMTKAKKKIYSDVGKLSIDEKFFSDI